MGRHSQQPRLSKFLRRAHSASRQSQPPLSDPYPYTEADVLALVARVGSEYPPPLVWISDLQGENMTDDDWAVFTRALSGARGRDLFPEEEEGTT